MSTPSSSRSPASNAGTVDIAVNDVAVRDLRALEILFGDAAGDFVEVGADDQERIFVEHFTARGAFANYVPYVFEECAVAAAHIADAGGLEFEGPVEDFDEDVVAFREVYFVRAGGGPDIHGAVDEELDAVVIGAGDARVAEHQRAHDGKHRKIRDRDAIGVRDSLRHRCLRA